MNEPTVIECPSACTVTLQQEVTLIPFTLTLAEAGAISMAIIFVWAVAFGARVIARILQSTGPNEEV